MSVVAIYRFRGTFRVKPELVSAYPKGRASLEGILFLAQAAPDRADAAAQAAFVKHEVADAEILGFGLLKVELLATDEYRHFTAQFEQAQCEGSALVYYPNSSPASQKAQRDVVASGFSPSGRPAP